MPAQPHVRPLRESFSAGMRRLARRSFFAATFWLLAQAGMVRATILWSDLSATLVHETGAGGDILGGALKEDDASTNTLYFKFHVDPLSDASTEEYFAAFELYEGDKERLGVGNALKAWAYSAFKADANGDSNEGSDYIDLHSSRPEPPPTPGTLLDYENPHRGIECTIVFKVQYVADDDDLVTVWLNPDLGPGATESAQPESLITRFRANASFNEIHLRHGGGGGGGGWIFSDMAVATSFSDFVAGHANESNGSGLGVGTLPFTFRSWQREQGLPEDLVRTMAQTRDGYIWIGTDDGVARFDGVKFVSFSLPEGLRSGPVRTLLGDSRSALWIGSVGSGLIRYQDGRFTTFTTKDGLPSDSITALAEDGDGKIWIGTDSGLAVWENNRFTKPAAMEKFNGDNITALFKDRQNNVWIAASSLGVFEFHDGELTQLPDAEGLLQDPHSLLVDKQGRIWIGAGDDFLLCRDGNQWRPYRIPRHLTRSYIGALAEQPDGTVWAGSVSEGLFQFKNGKLVTVNASSGLSDNSVNSLLVDRDGDLWAGTDVGLNLLRKKNLFAFGPEEGLGYGAVDGMAEIAPGIVCVAKADGLYRWSGGSFSRLNSAILAINGPQINALLVAHDGSCWIAGARGLLHFKNPNQTVDKAELFTLAGLPVTSLCEAQNGALWVGTREGKLWRLQNGNWSAETNFNRPVTAIVADGDEIWIGTEGDGVYRLKNGASAHLIADNGLLSNLIRTLYLDQQGVLWIGTAGGGLSRYSGGHVVSFTTREGLPDDTISQILEDDAGRLWLGSNRGIACVSKRDLDSLAAGKISAIYPQTYGRAEGMLSEECTGGFGPAGLKTKSGWLWFSTLKGAVAVDPRLNPTKSSAPNVLLEEMWVDGVLDTAFRPVIATTQNADGTAKSEMETLRLASGKHRIELKYTGLNFDAPEQIQFRYRLDGLDSDWVEAGTRRTAFYNLVPPGKYRFHVIACNAEGVWNDTGVNLALIVPPYFWQSHWFLALVVLSLLGIAVVGARIVEKRRLHRRLNFLEQEHALERERARIARDLHDEMGAKLCRISFLSEHAKRIDSAPAELQRQITSISDTSREVLYSLDEIVWAINPQNDALEHVASYIGHYAQEYFQETGIKCELDIPARLPVHPLSSQLRHQLLLAVHEAFTNVLKHSRATRCDVSIRCSDVSLEIIISDNGTGFDSPATLNGNPSKAVAGNGLRNMSQRLTTIGGHCRIESAAKTGTQISFVLPFEKRHE